VINRERIILHKIDHRPLVHVDDVKLVTLDVLCDDEVKPQVRIERGTVEDGVTVRYAGSKQNRVAPSMRCQKVECLTWGVDDGRFC